MSKINATPAAAKAVLKTMEGVNWLANRRQAGVWVAQRSGK